MRIQFLEWNGNSVNIGLTTGHEFETGDYVALSGISTDSLRNLEKYFRIKVRENSRSRCISSISSSVGTATTEIYVSFIPNISIGSTIGIGSRNINHFEYLYRFKYIKSQERFTRAAHNRILYCYLCKR